MAFEQQVNEKVLHSNEIATLPASNREGASSSSASRRNNDHVIFAALLESFVVIYILGEMLMDVIGVLERKPTVLGPILRELEYVGGSS